MKINGSLIFDASSASEIQNLRVQKVSSNPTHGAADVGRLIYNTTDNTIYIGGASAWVALATGGNAAALQTEVDALETSLGAIVNSSGVFVPGQVTILGSASTATTLTGLLGELAAAISGKDALSELVDVNVTGVGDKDLLQFNNSTGKWEDKAIGSASGVQAYDAGLDALAAFNTNGIVVQTAENTFAGRSLTQPAKGITITDGDGVAGNPTFALANDLAAVEGLTGNGFAVRTGSDAWAVRSIESGVSGTIVVGTGDGATGNTALDLQTLTIPTNAGSLLKFNYDTYGRVTAVKAVATADLTGLLDATYVNVSGDTMTGNLSFGGSYKVTGLAAPSDSGDAVNKNYVDNLVAGMTWEAPVKNIVADTTARDALTLTAGDRVYVTADNKVYTYNGTGFDSGEVMADGAAFFNSSTDTGYVYNGTALVPFTGGGALTAGNGLVMTGNQLDVNFGAGVTMLPSDEVGLHIHNYTGSAIGFALAADGSRVALEASAATGDKLNLFLDGSTLAQSGSGLKIASGGVTEVEINSSARDTNGGLVGGSGTKLSVNVDGSTLEINTNVVRVKDSGIVTAKIADANVTNAKLANSTITVSDGTTTDAVALGETLTFTGGTGITTTVSANTVAIAFDGTEVSIGDLSDVGTATPTAGRTLVGNGTVFNSQKIYHKEVVSTAAATWTVNHGLGQQFVNVTVMAETSTPGEYEVVIPQSITMTTANQVVVTFNTAIAGAVAVMGIA